MVYLSGAHPKRTRLVRLLRVLGGALSIAFIAWVLASLPYDILRAERSRLFGEEATTGLILTARTDENPDFPHANLVIVYKYVDPDGYARRAEARIPDSLWQHYQPGMIIKVLLTRGRPDMARTPDEVEPAFQIWLRNLMH